jgi:hypothetical protein
MSNTLDAWPAHTCEWVTWRLWMSHVAHVDESCPTCEWVRYVMWDTLDAWRAHKCDWDTSRICISGVVVRMSRMWIPRVTFVNNSCHTCEYTLRMNTLYDCEWLVWCGAEHGPRGVLCWIVMSCVWWMGRWCAGFYASQVLVALEYLHGKDIVSALQYVAVCCSLLHCVL